MVEVVAAAVAVAVVVVVVLLAAVALIQYGIAVVHTNMLHNMYQVLGIARGMRSIL